MEQTVTATVMRSINRTAILNLIREKCPIARSQIARQLNISLPTVMRIMDDLIEEDLVRLQEGSESTGGRPRRLVEFNGDAYAVVGVDLGGSKMFGTVANLSGDVQHEIYLEHEEDGPDDYVGRLCELIEQLLETPRPPGQKIRGIGIGVPALMHGREGVVGWAPALGWRDLPLKEMLSERFAPPVFVENDVNLAALGELGFGAGRGAQNLVCIAVGTGIGAGIIVDGALYRGHNQASGEVGYLLPGIKYLGRQYDQFGALESLASGSGIAARAQQVLQEAGQPVPSGSLSAEVVFCAARQGESWAQQIVDETVDYLSLAIATVSSLLDPEMIVLGGPLSAAEPYLLPAIQEAVENATLPEIREKVQILLSAFGPDASVMGAVALVVEAILSNPGSVESL